MRPFTRLRRKLWIISILLAISLRFNAISIAFYTPNAIHAVCSVETSPTVRKMRPFTRLWRKLGVISLLLQIFRHLNSMSIAFYAPNAIHAVFSVETSPTVRKMRPYTRFWRKLCVIFGLLEIFRRLNAISIAFHTPSAILAVFGVESSPTVRKMRPFTRFWRKQSGISRLLGIFRRLIAISFAFYTPNDTHASFVVET